MAENPGESSMNPYYLAGMFVGAFVAVSILSRVLFLGARTWPTSLWKLFYINALTAALAISWAIVGSAVSAGGELIHVGERFLMYGLAQCLVFAIDLMRHRSKTTIIERAEPRF
jgi:hypothetical protein